MQQTRLYKTAQVQDNIVHLDDKKLHTPAGRDCALPTAALAQAVAMEWNAQGEKIQSLTMPLTQLSMTAIDRVPNLRADIEAELLRYLQTELICHYSDNKEAAAHQRRVWQPVHEWLGDYYNVTLPVTAALVPLPMGDDTWAAQQLSAYDDFQLTALQQAVSVCGSFAIGLALCEGVIDAAAALDAAEAESDFQAMHWGQDDDYVARRAGMLFDLNAVQEFISLLKP